MGIHYDNQLDCFRKILAENGPMGFYRGWSFNTARLIPFFLVSMPVAEQIRCAMGYGYFT